MVSVGIRALSTRSAEQFVDLVLRDSFPRQLRPLKIDTNLKIFVVRWQLASQGLDALSAADFRHGVNALLNKSE